MEQSKIIQKLKRIADAIIPEGYYYAEEEGYNGIPVTIIRKTINFVYNVGVWIDSKNSYSQFNTTVYFKQVEEVLNPLLVKHGIIEDFSEENNRTIWLKTIEPEMFKQTLNPSYPKTIETEQDVID
ncbi:hypothetical protein [Pedobacter endophyticus]|uniref:Uncharacterized protein n=1 Tax=Pedobacter endophyticus TaxID=2789740 RepID=A0A7S9KYZ4_9SPHI|nr:hypothetical protein [Pedobacter endophyticus]QPH39448.1 hypothetical protein IZT61_20790 [Pedobacter endophyticus]